MNLSIITVVLNDLNGIKKTLDSILLSNTKKAQLIIIDGYSNDGTWEYLLSKKSKIDVLIQSKPKGIYNAMNIAIDYIKCDYHIFINSSDEIHLADKIQIINNPCFIPVKTNSKKQFKSKPKKYNFLGMIYCHQGIIFPSLGVKYDERFSIASDYLYFLKHEKYFTDLKINYNMGYAFFDTNGVSSSIKGRLKSRLEERIIIRENFNIVKYFISEIRFQLIFIYKKTINYYS